jgi:trimethylamine:corrinoid methyltransferase-like protein
MKSKNSAIKGPLFRVLSDEQIQEIHLATLEVLERTGVEVQEPEALDLLKKAGARVDGDRVRIPPALIKQAIQTAPERVVLCSRNGERTMPIESSKVYFGTGSDLPFTIDPYTGERRDSTKQDVANVALVSDALPNISFVMSGGIATDVSPTRDSYLHQFDAMVNNTTKPIIYTAHDNEDMRYIYEMAKVVAGGEQQLQANPFMMLYTESISPLIHSGMGTEKLLFCAEHHIPVIYTVGLMSGSTAPVTKAGALVTGNAESLSGLLIAQLKNPGTPVLYGGCFGAMDMRTSIYAYGCPSQMIMSAASADMAQYYKLPLFSLAGASDAKTADVQAGIELGSSLMITALSGANIIHDVGYLESGLTMSLAMLVAADETAEMIGSIMNCIEVNEETLALDVIDDVGPGGNFLTHDHTLNNFRKEHWHSKLMDRRRYDAWIDDGGKTYQERAAEKAREILENHKPQPLPEKIRTELREIIGRRSLVQA